MELFYRFAAPDSNRGIRSGPGPEREDVFEFTSFLLEAAIEAILDSPQQRVQAPSAFRRNESDVRRRRPSSLHQGTRFVKVGDQLAIIVTQQVHLVERQQCWTF